MDDKAYEVDELADDKIEVILRAGERKQDRRGTFL